MDKDNNRKKNRRKSWKMQIKNTIYETYHRKYRKNQLQRTESSGDGQRRVEIRQSR